MHRTAQFKSTIPDDWEFDENDNSVTPGSRELADAIVTSLRSNVSSVSEVTQHKFYGWGFETIIEKEKFYNVLNPADGECYLTYSMNGFLIKKLLLRNPQRTCRAYERILENAISAVPEASDVCWLEK